MAPLTGPVLAAALLLVSSGALKLVRPAAMAAALAGFGAVRSAGLLARGIGAAEVAVGGWVVLTGSAPAALAAGLVYAGFTAFLVYGLRAPQRVRTCGCTGSVDGPPTPEHAVLTAGLAALALAAAAGGGVLSVSETAVTDGLAGVTVLGYAVVVAALAWAVMALLPRVRGVR